MNKIYQKVQKTCSLLQRRWLYLLCNTEPLNEPGDQYLNGQQQPVLQVNVDDDRIRYGENGGLPITRAHINRLLRERQIRDLSNII